MPYKHALQQHLQQCGTRCGETLQQHQQHDVT
jgi:hypothetical protein